VVIRILHPDNHVFIHFEQSPLNRDTVLHSLPQLRQELSERWPNLNFHIEHQAPRFRNPVDPEQFRQFATLMSAAGEGALIVFTLSAVKAAGTEIGKSVGKDIGRFARQWFNKKFGTNKPRRVPNKTKRKTKR
jgi:hypothetical protein